MPSRCHLYSFIKIYHCEYKNWIRDPFSCRLIFNCHFFRLIASSVCSIDVVLLLSLPLLAIYIYIYSRFGGHFYYSLYNIFCCCCLKSRVLSTSKRHLKRDLLDNSLLYPSSLSLVCRCCRCCVWFVIVNFCVIPIAHMWNVVEFNGNKFPIHSEDLESRGEKLNYSNANGTDDLTWQRSPHLIVVYWRK